MHGMRHLLTPKSISFSLFEFQKDFALPEPPEKKQSPLTITLIPGLDKLLIIQGEKKEEISLLSSDDIERELNRNNEVELNVILGTDEKLRVRIIWRKVKLEGKGGSKAKIGKYIEEVKIERQNAFPEQKKEINNEFESVILEMKAKNIRHIIFQTVDLFKNNQIWKSIECWYTK